MFSLNNIRDFIESLPIKEFTAEERENIESKFPVLYQSNNDLEEFCIRHQINPINIWYWFKHSNVIPKQRTNDLAMELLADLIREILMEDEDGIIPLVPNAGEKVLLERIEEKLKQIFKKDTVWEVIIITKEKMRWPLFCHTKKKIMRKKKCFN